MLLIMLAALAAPETAQQAFTPREIENFSNSIFYNRLAELGIKPGSRLQEVSDVRCQPAGKNMHRCSFSMKYVDPTGEAFTVPGSGRFGKITEAHSVDELISRGIPDGKRSND